PFLSGSETGAATAAAFVLLASGDPQYRREVLDACTGASTAELDGLRIALRHSEPGPVEDALYDLGIGRDARLRAVAADILTFHRLRPPPELECLLENDEPAIRARAFEAAGRAGRILGGRQLRRALDDHDPG